MIHNRLQRENQSTKRLKAQKTWVTSGNSSPSLQEEPTISTVIFYPKVIEVNDALNLETNTATTSIDKEKDDVYTQEE